MYPTGSIGLKFPIKKYDENSAFGLLTAPFTHEKLPSITRVLWYVLDPDISKISDNIYHYCLYHCANCGPQVKGIEFDQSSYTVLAANTLRLIVAIAVTYYITIGIEDITNAFHNILTNSYEREIVDLEPHYLS